MRMQETNPLPWGALDRFQTHFIVRRDIGADVADYVARIRLVTKGHFGSKQIVSVRWEGGRLADILNEDSQINDRIIQQPINEASISVEPTEGAVRIHSKWQNRHDLGITRELFEIYDAIAAHVKNL